MTDDGEDRMVDVDADEVLPTTRERVLTLDLPAAALWAEVPAAAG